MVDESYVRIPVDGAGKKLRTIKRNIDENEVHDEVIEIADPSGKIISPATDEGAIFQELQKLVWSLNPLMKLAVDSAGRLRIIIDVAGTATPVTATLAAGTASFGVLGAGGVFPVDQRFELIQRANIEYDQVQRSKMVIT